MARTKKLIYVIEDEFDIAELIAFNLNLEGFEVKTFYCGEDGLKAVEQETPDLIVLDLMLPGINGYETCQKMKSIEKMEHTPIIMLTAKGEEDDVIRGLEHGARDYITKPFSPKILMARVRAALRDTEKSLGNEHELINGKIQVHTGRCEVHVDNQPIELTKSEFQILHNLMKKPGWVFTRNQIIDMIHGKNYAVTDRSIDFQMVGLRRKLMDAGEYIETVRGVGYRFKDLR